MIFQENGKETFNQVKKKFITDSCEFVIHFCSFFYDCYGLFHKSLDHLQAILSCDYLHLEEKGFL